jgi:hypothetical protein
MEVAPGDRVGCGGGSQHQRVARAAKWEIAPIGRSHGSLLQQALSSFGELREAGNDLERERGQGGFYIKSMQLRCGGGRAQVQNRRCR